VSAGARAYNGGLEAEPPAVSRGRAPGQGVRGAKPPEAQNLLAFEHPNKAANLSLICTASDSVNRRYFISVSPKLKEWSTRSISVTILAHCLATDSHRETSFEMFYMQCWR